MKNDGVVVDGKVYKSDSFYLLKTTDNNNENNDNNYLDRRRLLASLDLVGIIASTYSFDDDWFYQQELFPSHHPNKIPTLILMDSKKNASSTTFNNKKRKPPSNSTTNTTATSFLQKRMKKRIQSPIFSLNPTTTDDTTKTICPNKNQNNNHNNYSNVYISKIAPSYYDSSLKKRKRMLGVCHSKYMILLERSGSIVLFISTANLTRPMSTDACWLQRFHLKKQPEPKNNNNHFDGDEIQENDFEQVWYTFLNAQSKCIVSTNNDTNLQITPWKFLQIHRNLLIPPQNKSISSLKEWVQSYNWNTSTVFLVSTIPGKFSSSNTKIAYGAQRMAQIQKQILSSWIPSQQKQQQLIFQPTSLGGGQWTRQHLLTILQSYCTETTGVEEEELLQRFSILWPSMDYMKQVSSSNRKQGVDCHTHAFLSTKSFNELNLDILSRMYVYTTNPSVCPQNNDHDNNKLSIHFKSYLQCLGSSKHELAWFLLTSACFSKGAQGQLDSKSLHTNHNDTIMTYSNFELGILFASRLQGNPKTDRLYTTMEQLTDTTSFNSTTNVISLPIPYCIHRMIPYQRSNDMDFQVTPYFHEITPGTDTVGQMALTPYGKQRIKEQQRKEHNKNLD